jgi:hypothetical protein
MRPGEQLIDRARWAQRREAPLLERRMGHAYRRARMHLASRSDGATTAGRARPAPGTQRTWVEGTSAPAPDPTGRWAPSRPSGRGAGPGQPQLDRAGRRRVGSRELAGVDLSIRARPRASTRTLGTARLLGHLPWQQGWSTRWPRHDGRSGVAPLPKALARLTSRGDRSAFARAS